MNKKFKTKDYAIIITALFILSLIINIFSYVNIRNYKYRIGKESQISIEDVRQRNESNMDILNMSIDQRCIKNEELLKLYKNYEIITNGIIKLWEQYGEYKANNFSMFSKKIETKKIIENDVHSRIKEYMFIVLNEAMKNRESGLILSENYLNDFVVMQELSRKIYTYFEEFNSEKLSNFIGIDREKKIIMNNYWIDMLQGIYNISDEYSNIQWSVSDIENVNNIDIINESK
ncbi:hypothetical protein NE172_01275 [Clostridium botulinum]|uniref:Uncharacterized protein n=1 Tax=Clostridium botulinum TaxID=1491 RepID=A0A6B4JHC3_CLOBO|nr:hypothetical protein [Clostridium botulinum]EES48498.1 putative reticulocyte-binding protein [Clostridium botulinum E1 str. 'BoNT E Beluga']MBY6759576.1 hypothetical protein [Clostridium botulinum]MBY6918484.1 hypothetical protein [Clostridium botulinum]MCR1129568.1 hypothetical protein [Clostridium botulinum]NFH68029.1 hypothetical protein [Clostridium botulinum]